MRPASRTSFSLLVALAALAACDSSGTAPTPAAIQLTTENATLTAIGASTQIVITLLDGSGSSVPGNVTWETSNAAVATVAPTGMVTAVANGSAVITATVGEADESLTITVAQRAATVWVEVPAGPLILGTTVQLVGTARDARGNDIAAPAFDWQSSNPDVATVDGVGRLTAHRSGEVTITATLDGIVREMDVAVKRSTLQPQSDTVLAGFVAVEDLRIPAGVTVTAADDLVLDALGSATVEGRLVAPCARFELTARDGGLVSGEIDNTCPGSGQAGPDLTLSLLGDSRIEGATLSSSGTVLLRGDTVTTMAGLLAQAMAVGSSGGAAGVDDGDLEVVASTVTAGAGTMAGGGSGGTVGGDGGSAPSIGVWAPGRVRADGTRFTTATGGPGGAAEASGSVGPVTATGGKGGDGGSVVLRGGLSTQITALSGPVVFDPGAGGAGGAATATALQSAEATVAAAAQATGGDAGHAGRVFIRSSQAIASGAMQVVVKDGAQGGRAEARGANGLDATSTWDAQAGGAAYATGGLGGDATVLRPGNPQSVATWVVQARKEGKGGQAIAVAGNGGDGIQARPNGADGGDAEARGGDVPAALGPDLAGQVSTGASASVSGGNGGRGAGICQAPTQKSLSGLVRALTDPANSDRFIFDAGTEGAEQDLLFREQQFSQGGDGGAGGRLTIEIGLAVQAGVGTAGPGGNGGNGGDGFPSGKAGESGTVVPPSTGALSYQGLVGVAGVGGALCTSVLGVGSPPAEPSGPSLTIGAQAEDGLHPVSLTGAAPWVGVTGTMAADGTITAEGLGVVAGLPNVTVRFTGTFDVASGVLTGEYVMDTEQVVFPQHPITYGVEMTVTGG